jgi:hypothetical protein
VKVAAPLADWPSLRRATTELVCPGVSGPRVKVRPFAVAAKTPSCDGLPGGKVTVPL